MVQSCFNGRRIVVFSGGETSGTGQLLETVRAIRHGGATGAMIGRDVFQRPREESLSLLSSIIAIFRQEA